MKKRPYDNITAAHLRAAGWEVHVRHSRRYVMPESTAYLQKHEIKDGQISDVGHAQCVTGEFELQPTGGVTSCDATPPGGSNIFKFATCSTADNYCRATGTKVALRKVLHAFWKEDEERNGAILLEIRNKQRGRGA